MMKMKMFAAVAFVLLGSIQAYPSKLPDALTNGDVSEQYEYKTSSDDLRAKLGTIFVLRLSMYLDVQGKPCEVGSSGCKLYHPDETADSIRTQIYGTSAVETPPKFRGEGDTICASADKCGSNVLELFCESALVGNEDDCKNFKMLDAVKIFDATAKKNDKDPKGFWRDLDPNDVGAANAEKFCQTPRHYQTDLNLNTLRWFKDNDICAQGCAQNGLKIVLFPKHVYTKRATTDIGGGRSNWMKLSECKGGTYKCQGSAADPVCVGGTETFVRGAKFLHNANKCGPNAHSSCKDVTAYDGIITMSGDKDQPVVVYAHEIGHQLGLTHANAWQGNKDAKGLRKMTAYGDSAMMGLMDEATLDFHAPSRYFLGWIDPARVDKTSSKVELVALNTNPKALPTSASNKHIAVKELYSKDNLIVSLRVERTSGVAGQNNDFGISKDEMGYPTETANVKVPLANKVHVHYAPLNNAVKAGSLMWTVERWCVLDVKESCEKPAGGGVSEGRPAHWLEVPTVHVCKLSKDTATAVVAFGKTVQDAKDNCDKDAAVFEVLGPAQTPNLPKHCQDASNYRNYCPDWANEGRCCNKGESMAPGFGTCTKTGTKPYKERCCFTCSKGCGPGYMLKECRSWCNGKVHHGAPGSSHADLPWATKCLWEDHACSGCKECGASAADVCGKIPTLGCDKGAGDKCAACGLDRTAATDCIACNPGYKLSGKKCVPIGCVKGSDDKCATCVAQKDRETDKDCATCNHGYKLNGNKCVPTWCVAGTSGDKCATCVAQKDRKTDEDCATCNNGYKLSGNKRCVLDSDNVHLCTLFDIYWGDKRYEKVRERFFPKGNTKDLAQTSECEARAAKGKCQTDEQTRRDCCATCHKECPDAIDTKECVPIGCVKGSGDKCATCIDQKDRKTDTDCATCNPGYKLKECRSWCKGHGDPWGDDKSGKCSWDTHACSGCAECGTSGGGPNRCGQIACDSGADGKCATCRDDRTAATECATCNPGYKESGKKCVPIECVEGSDGKCATCVAQKDRKTDEVCATCNPGYKLSGNKCVPIECVEGSSWRCATCLAQKDRKTDEVCATCNPGYNLSGKQCVAIGCKSGSGDKCAACVAPKDRKTDQDCATCNDGYELSGKKCVAIGCDTGAGDKCKTCRADRTAATDCATCNDGYKLSGNKCVAIPTPACGSPKYKGDGNCDDNNNNKECDWDGGDCCAASAPNKKVSTTYCKDCQCLDPANACGSPKHKGDAYCDDDNNNKLCNWDGGACCAASAPNKKVSTKYCKDCQCLDPANACGSPKHKGDAYCDDDNNNKGCDWDGGDCCAASAPNKKVSTTYCKDCKCLDPDHKDVGEEAFYAALLS